MVVRLHVNSQKLVFSSGRLPVKPREELRTQSVLGAAVGWRLAYMYIYEKR